MLHKTNQHKSHKLMTQRYGYAMGGIAHKYGSPPPFMDMSDPSYVGIPPIHKMKDGGLVVEKEVKPKQNYFQRRK